jgi:hypothetical protein
MNMQVTEQAPTPSVEERAAAALFGSTKPELKPAQQPRTAAPEQEPEVPEGTAPEAETTEQPEAATDATEQPIAEETFEFEHEGEKWALPKKLEKALQNNRDYTQKAQELANQRRAIEALNEQAKVMHLTRDFEASIATDMQRLTAYDQVLSQPMDPNQSEQELLRGMLQRNQWKDDRDTLARTINAKHQEYMRNHEKAVSDFKSKAAETVAKRVPGWNDAMWRSIQEHAKSDGYTDVELGAIADPRHQITLWKAHQYDQMKAKAAPAVAAVKAVKTTPSNPMPQHVKDKLNFNKALKQAPTSYDKNKVVEQRLGALFKK